MIPQMQNLYSYIKQKLMPEMAKGSVPKLHEENIRDLAEKGKTEMLFGKSLRIKFFIIEKDLYSPYKVLSQSDESIIKKYK
jgi:hypothetical protein